MEPITRSEQYLASIIGEDVVLPVPQSRIEHYLNLIAQNGISPSSAGLISYDPDADYPDGSLGAGMKAEAAEVNDLKSAIGENGANILAAYPTDNASGAVASFSDGAAVPVKNLVVNIEPVQSGSGDPTPSNVRPISGWTQVKASLAGKNLMPLKALAGLKSLNTSGTWNDNVYTRNGVAFEVNDDGSIHVSASDNSDSAALVLTDRFIVKGAKYRAYSGVLSGGFGAYGVQIYNADSSATYVTTGDDGTSAFNLPQVSLKARIFVWSGQTFDVVFKPMLCFDPIDDSAFEPYSGSICTVDLDGTRYGGTLDVLTGVLTVDRAIVDLGTLTWNYVATANHERMYSQGIRSSVKSPAASNIKANIVCSAYKTVTADNTYSHTYNSAIAVYDHNIYIYDADMGTDADAFKTAVSGVQLVYELASPQTVRLTAGEMTALPGENNVWADTGDVSVTYRADPSLYVDKKVSAAEQVMELIVTANREDSMTATKAYVSGDLIITGGKLYKATTSIANGATLTVGTNVSQTTVAAEIAAVS